MPNIPSENTRRHTTSVFLLMAFALVALLLTSMPAQASSVIEGRVVRVADGDTITVLDAGNRQHRIRLKGIDAPERHQPFGNVSQRSLSEMVAGRQVRVRADDADRFGRTIGVVFVNGQDANLEMIRMGMAWHYKQFARDQTPAERESYSASEQEARAARKGLWIDRNPVPPWEVRPH